MGVGKPVCLLDLRGRQRASWIRGDREHRSRHGAADRRSTVVPHSRGGRQHPGFDHVSHHAELSPHHSQSESRRSGFSDEGLLSAWRRHLERRRSAAGVCAYLHTMSHPPKATRREWLGLAVIALPCVLYSMDLTVLNLAVPRISADLHPSSTELLWIVDIYGFLVAGFLITMGTLGDRIGRRRLLLTGATAFGGASVLAAFSSSPELLIAARALLGIAGATL